MNAPCASDACAVAALPDFVAPGLRVLSVGLNPSLLSVEAGFPFANPRNRFWRALAASGLVAGPLEPGVGAMHGLLEQGIGFTDLAQRPTRGGAELRAADYRAGAPRLYRLIVELRPAWVWFHGRVPWTQFLRHAPRAARPLPADTGWGLQAGGLGPSRVWVTPNPSPANAGFSLEDLVGHYRVFRRALEADLVGYPAREYAE